MGDINPVDIIANVATGGLYGAAESGVNVASGKQDLLGGLRSGFNQVGPWGSATYGVSPQLAESGNLIGAGGGLGGAYGAPFMGAMGGMSAEQLMQQLGGQPTPQGGASPAMPTNSGGGLNAQQLAALSAMNSQAHRGLAPSFESRMQGKSPGAGIAGDAFGQFNQGV